MMVAAFGLIVIARGVMAPAMVGRDPQKHRCMGGL